MNWTAVFHASATVIAGVGVFALDRPATIAALVVAAALFVAGIVVARRDSASSEPDPAE